MKKILTTLQMFFEVSLNSNNAVRISSTAASAHTHIGGKVSE